LEFCFNSRRQIAYFYFTDNSYVSPYFYVIVIVGAENERPNPEQYCI